MNDYSHYEKSYRWILVASVWQFFYSLIGIGLHFMLLSHWSDMHHTVAMTLTIVFLIIYIALGVGITVVLVLYFIDRRQRAKYSYLLDQLENNSTGQDVTLLS